MSLKDLAKHYPFIMRLSLAFVFAWFGISEILNPTYFSGYVPPFIVSLPFFNFNLFIQTHGVALVFLAVCFLFRFYLRYVGVLALLVLLSIIGGLISMNGFDEIVVRDIGLLGLAVSIWFYEIKREKKN